MSRTFLISDTHFFHDNVLTFKNADGSPLRPFTTLSEMHDTMIENWNSVVSPKDKVYHLGDVGFRNSTSLKILESLNGDKVLIRGNHDVQKATVYLSYFRDVRAYHVLDNLLFAHIPVHPFSLTRWRGQAHGHLHNQVMDSHKYYNVSVERINYTPIDFEIIRQYFKDHEQDRH